MSEVHKGDRHPNGVPKTVHHYDEKTGAPVYHHEVVPMDPKDLVALGHSEDEAAAMVREAGGGKRRRGGAEAEE